MCDPYTTENYAIPSTRATRIAAVNHTGSIPATVNSMMDAGLAKAMGAVEAYTKGSSPLPFVRLPAAGLVLSGHKSSGAAVEADVSVGLGGSSGTWTSGMSIGSSFVRADESKRTSKMVLNSPGSAPDQ